MAPPCRQAGAVRRGGKPLRENSTQRRMRRRNAENVMSPVTILILLGAGVLSAVR